MGRLNDIDYAIVETLKAHPNFTIHINSLYMDNLTSPTGINLVNFTSRNGARSRMIVVTQNDMLHVIMRYLISITMILI